MVHDAKYWLKVIHLYLDNKMPMTQLCKTYDVDLSKLKYRVNLYLLYGEKPFTDEQQDRVYTREEKLKAIHEVLDGKKSSRQVALEMAVPNPHTVQDWVNKYKTEGEEAIQVSRGRKKYMLHEDRQRFLAEKELKERNKFLEMENDVLKKSLALISKRKDYQSKRKSRLLKSLRANMDSTSF